MVSFGVNSRNNNSVEKFRRVATETVEAFESVHGESRGACRTIAGLIAESIPGAEVVGGYVCMVQGEMQHWWVEVDGNIIDPLSEKYADEPYYHRRVLPKFMKNQGENI